MGSCCSKIMTRSPTAVSNLSPFFRSHRESLPVSLTLSDVKAALLIQKWFRAWSSKLIIRREVAWNIFQELEYFGEQDQLRLSKMFKLLIQEFQDTKKINLISQHLSYNLSTQYSSTTEEALFREYEVPLEVVPGDYAGIAITTPYSSGKLEVLVNDFRCGKLIHAAYVSKILKDMILKMKTRKNLYNVTTSVTKKVTIIGDLHGSLDDLLTIFHKNNLPSTTNPYVFNGDIVDRGHKSMEVCMIIFYCILVFPNHVFLNRGNHEDPVLNRRYGFIKEVTQRYRNFSKNLLVMFNMLFKLLPLGSLIDHKILVVHGGISNVLDLDKINNIPRDKFLSVIRPGPDVETYDKENWEHFLDILWSDPMKNFGCVDNLYRGSGKYFGPDVTGRFLQKNNLLLLIRSHECKPNGFEYTHNNQVLTVFSASNYYERGSNKGAYIVYTGDVTNLSIVEYITNEIALEKLNIKDQIISLETTAFNKIKEMIRMKLPDFKEAIAEFDTGKTGEITTEEFCQCLSKVLKVKLPWRLIIRRICDVDSNNMVNYENTFKMMDLENSSALTKMYLYDNREILETIFRTFDVDNSGTITMNEFKDGMKMLLRHTKIGDFQANDIENLGRTMDFNNDGQIDINEFFEAFRLSTYTWR